MCIRDRMSPPSSVVLAGGLIHIELLVVHHLCYRKAGKRVTNFRMHSHHFKERAREHDEKNTETLRTR